jgi:hypothetical protein
MNVWFQYGRIYGFAIGFNFSKYNLTFDLGFWYIGVEF